MTTYRRWLIPACCWLWTFTTVIPSSNAGWDREWQVLFFPIGCFLFVWWLGESVFRPGVFTTGRARWLWLSVPVVLLMSLAVARTNLLLTYRVWLCERELREFAETVRAGEQKVCYTGPKRRVGLFLVHGTGGFGTEVNLMTCRGFCESYGITYWPDGIPNGSGDEYQHLYGPWYRYYTDF